MSNAIRTEISRTTVEGTRNDHKYGTTPVWWTTVVERVEFKSGRVFRDVMTFESTSPHGTGQVTGHYMEPWK